MVVLSKSENLNNIINLELHDPYAYKQPFKASFKGLNNIDKIFEILGSVVPNLPHKLKIKIRFPVYYH